MTPSYLQTYTSSFLTHTSSLSLSSSLKHTLSHSLGYTFSHSFSHIQAHSFSFSFKQTHSFSFSFQTNTLILIHSLTQIHSLLLTHSLSLLLNNTLSHSHSDKLHVSISCISHSVPLSCPFSHYICPYHYLSFSLSLSHYLYLPLLPTDIYKHPNNGRTRVKETFLFTEIKLWIGTKFSYAADIKHE